jgi:D-aminopeptidase
LPPALGGYTVGALVQTNYGGVLTINGAPVGRELGKFYLKEELERAAAGTPTRASDAREKVKRQDAADAMARADKREATADTAREDTSADGSIIIVIATDAPVDARNLRRMAARAMIGLGRTGSAATNGSGDYVIAFSTAPEVRIRLNASGRAGAAVAPRELKLLSNDAMSPLFLAVIEATEEAIYNSLFRAQTLKGRGGLTIEALPLERTLDILRKYNALSTQ